VVEAVAERGVTAEGDRQEGVLVVDVAIPGVLRWSHVAAWVDNFSGWRKVRGIGLRSRCFAAWD